MEVHKKRTEPWRVTIVDTGEETMTGGRLKRVKDYIGDETFCFTYGDGAWINGGFFVLEPSAIDYISGDAMPWERDPLENLAAEKELTVYKHKGFWRPMDTLRDKMQLEEMWDAGKAPWKIW